MAIAADDSGQPVDFDRDIRPILSDTCFQCHGPDEKKRASKLRLDTQEGALATVDDHRAIVPGKPEQSELIRRIASTDPDERMPPGDSGLELSPAQIELLTRWIAQGARWREHWALAKRQRPTPPAASGRTARVNEIDDFVLASLQQLGLEPSPPAEKPALLRRVTLDLTGVPPTIEELDAFLADSSPQAYERAVDRLLRSPRYGERMAMVWLDAARYADTSGYQNDGPRSMWRWRDWVIESFNANMPFDRFTIEQLAGDLLPGATLQQRIATGFNRNHRGNAEGGIIPEEYQVEYVADRVDTTFTVWLGLTIGCARCHDHKYDPLKQREFYQVFAYFNNLPEFGRAIKEGNSPPYVVAPTREQEARLAQLDRELSSAEDTWASLTASADAAQAQWEQQPDDGRAGRDDDGTPSDGLVARFPLDGNVADRVADTPGGRFDRPGGGFVGGKLGQAARLDGQCLIDAGDVGRFGYFDKFSLAAWIKPDEPNGTVISRMVPAEEADGYYVHLREGHVQVNLVKRWLDDSVRVETEEPIPVGQWQHLLVTYDASRQARGIRVYVDGAPRKMRVLLDALNQTFALPKEPLRIGGGQSHFRGAIDEVRVYARDLSTEEAQVLAVPRAIAEIRALPREQRSAAEQQKLKQYFVAQVAPPEIRRAFQERARLRDERTRFFESLPTVMVMEELPTPRETHLLIRGQYDKPGDRVIPGVPSVFPPLPADAPPNRLGFARWLVDPAHPLTARVAVNRFWQIYFGTGLVKTAEDFGVQGERPSHAELLDWLADEFVTSGWDVKALQKRIVMSATYRQSSRATPPMLARDPENRLLARGPRFRLPAELVRDQALAVSGLLQEKLGGPSVKPYQPEGLWKEIATDTVYDQSHGEDLYRRSLYTYWKRTVAPPTMVAFDATSREACTVRRSRTNTPLQSLALMNDVTFVESARVMAERVIAEGEAAPAARLARAFRLATSRAPTTAELELLTKTLAEAQRYYQANPSAADKLLAIGEQPPRTTIAPAETAAYAIVCSMILNLDEVVSKE